jgi:hypothetical protein
VSRRLPLLALVVAVTFAGCLGALDDGDEAGTSSVPGPGEDVPDPVEALPQAEVLPHDVGSAEPNTATLPNGTVFATAPVGLNPHPNAVEGSAWLWRSTDGGESWEVLRDPHVTDQDPADTGPFCSCDADVETSPDGWTYYTDWWSAGLVGGNYLVERSPDGGETWMSSPVTMPHPVTFSVDRQWLVAGQDGFVALFYAYFPGTGNVPDTGPLPNGRIEVVVSEDHGATWSGPRTVTLMPEGTFDQISNPAILPDGTLAMAYAHMTGEGDDFWKSPGQVRVATSTDGGETWKQRSVAGVPGGFDNLWAVETAADGSGTLHVAWAARTSDGSDRMAVYHAQSDDGGRTWSEPDALRSQGLNFLPWIEATGEGDVAVAWYGGNATGDPREASDDAKWYAYAARRPGPDANWTVAKADPRPVKEGPLCPIGSSCGDNRELLDYANVAYGEDRLHVLFARSETVTDEPQGALIHHTAAPLEAP